MVRYLGRQRRTEKPSPQPRSAMERSEKNADQPPAMRTLARTPTHRKEKAGRHAAHTDVESFGLQGATKCDGRAIIARVSMPFDGHAVPTLGAHLARHDGGLVALGLKGSGQIAQISPRLKVQLGWRERLGDDRNPKGLQESARASAPTGVESRWRVGFPCIG